MFKSSSISHTINYETDAWIRIAGNSSSRNLNTPKDVSEWTQMHLRWSASDQSLTVHRDSRGQSPPVCRLPISQIDSVRRKNRKLLDDLLTETDTTRSGLLSTIKQRVLYGRIDGDLICIRFAPEFINRSAEMTANWLIPSEPAVTGANDNENVNANDTYFDINLPRIQDMRQTDAYKQLQQQKLEMNELLIACGTMEESRIWQQLLSAAVNERWLQTMAKCFEKRSALSTYNSYANRVPIVKSAKLANSNKQQRQQQQVLERTYSVTTEQSAEEVVVINDDDDVDETGKEQQQQPLKTTFEQSRNRQVAVLVPSPPHVAQISEPVAVVVPERKPRDSFASSSTTTAAAKKNRVTAIVDTHISMVRPLEMPNSRPQTTTLSERTSNTNSRLIQLEKKQSQLLSSSTSKTTSRMSSDFLVRLQSPPSMMASPPPPPALIPLKSSSRTTKSQGSNGSISDSKPAVSSNLIRSVILPEATPEWTTNNIFSPTAKTNSVVTKQGNSSSKISSIVAPLRHESVEAAVDNGEQSSMRTTSLIRLTQLATDGDQFVNLIDLQQNIHHLKSKWAQWLQKWWPHIQDKSTAVPSTSWNPTAVSVPSPVRPIGPSKSSARVFSIVCDYEREEFDEELADILNQTALIRHESVHARNKFANGVVAVDDLDGDISRFDRTLSTLQQKQAARAEVELVSIADLLTQLSDISDRVEELRSSSHWSHATS